MCKKNTPSPQKDGFSIFFSIIFSGILIFTLLSFCYISWQSLKNRSHIEKLLIEHLQDSTTQQGIEPTTQSNISIPITTIPNTFDQNTSEPTIPDSTTIEKNIQDNSENIIKLMAEFNNLTNKDILSLFYTVITTIVFVWGLRYFTDMQTIAKEAKDKVSIAQIEVENAQANISTIQTEVEEAKIFISDMLKRADLINKNSYFNVFYSQILTLDMLSFDLNSIIDDGKRAERIRKCYELLGNCSGDSNGGNGMFPYIQFQEIKILPSILKFYIQKLLEETINRMKKTIKGHYELDNMNPNIYTIEKSINICNEYLELIKNIPEEDISLGV